jgi:predicted dehydrogenase
MRLVVVGLGFMGRVHLGAIAAVPGVGLAGVVTRDRFKLDADVRWYGDLAEALEDPGVDAVDLCLPTDLHEGAAIEALRRGKHVLVEKPMALDAAACDRMIEEARRRGRILMVAQVLRFMPAYAVLGSRLRGETVKAAAFRRRCAKPDWGEWLGDEKRSGGGVFDLLIHDVDLALHLFGAPEAISATGFGDLIGALLFYRDGLAVDISGGWFHDGFPFAMEYTVVTDRSTFEYHSGSGPGSEEVHRYASARVPENLTLDKVDGYAAEIAYFAECARSGVEPVRCRPEESAHAVRLTLAMIGARARNGEKISWKSG